MMKRIKELIAHQFVRNVAVLQVGSAIGSIIQATAGVVLARLLQPERFGIYALAFGLAGLTSLFLTIGTQDAMGTILGRAHARDDRQEILDATAFLLKIAILSGVIVALCALALPAIAGAIYREPIVGSYAVVIVLASVISASVLSLVTLLFQVAGDVRTMALLILTDQVIRWGLSIGFVLAGFGIWGAMAGHLLGATCMLVVAIFLWRRLRRRFFEFPSLAQTWHRMFSVPVRRFFRFSFFVAADRNVANLYGILPVLIVGLVVSTREVTFFKLSFGYINLALGLLGPISTLLNVQFPRIQVESRDKLRHDFIRVTLYGVFLSVALTAGAIFVAPVVFRILYGATFLESVPLVRRFAVYGALFGIGVGLGPMWRATGRVTRSIAVNLVTLAIGIPLGLSLIRQFGVTGGVAMVTLWYTVSHIASFILLERLLKKI